MRRKQLRFGKGFRVAISTSRAQVAEMVVPPKGAAGGPDNRHRTSDQWLYVVSGTGKATVNGRRYPLRAGTLMLIEHGDRHEVRNTGRQLLRTLNFYVPPGYTSQGDELPATRP